MTLPKFNISPEKWWLFIAAYYFPFGNFTGWFQIFLYFHPENRGRFPIWRAYFSDGWFNHQAVQMGMVSAIFFLQFRCISASSQLTARSRWPLNQSSWTDLRFAKKLVFVYLSHHHEIWSNYSDLTRPHPKWWFSKGIPLISGKSRLVKYYNLARWNDPCGFIYLQSS